MAKFADYVTQTDELDGEITEAAAKSEERESKIPERFKGKSAEEIADSYVELERKFSQQGNDLGSMRNQVDQLARESEARAQAAATAEEESTPPVSVDDLYEDPEAAIERVIEKRLKPQLEAQQQQLQQQTTEQRLGAFDDKYEGWRDKVHTPEFQEWIGKSAYRQRMAGAVRDANDLDAANDLLEQFYDTHAQAKNDEQNVVREEQLKDAALETGSAAYNEPAQTFSRNDLLEAKIAQKRGSHKADRWLKANYKAIQEAYAEGRITD